MRRFIYEFCWNKRIVLPATRSLLCLLIFAALSNKIASRPPSENSYWVCAEAEGPLDMCSAHKLDGLRNSGWWWRILFQIVPRSLVMISTISLTNFEQENRALLDTLSSLVISSPRFNKTSVCPHPMIILAGHESSPVRSIAFKG